MKRTTFYLLAALLITAVSLVPGIRGYESWAFYETALVYLLLGHALTQSYHRCVRVQERARGRVVQTK